jgi:hypothetical protein
VRITDCEPYIKQCLTSSSEFTFFPSPNFKALKHKFSCGLLSYTRDTWLTNLRFTLIDQYPSPSTSVTNSSTCLPSVVPLLNSLPALALRQRVLCLLFPNKRCWGPLTNLMTLRLRVAPPRHSIPVGGMITTTRRLETLMSSEVATSGMDITTSTRFWL